MLVVGLTGGIGSGKSTVAEFFAREGVPVIDADIIAHDLTLANQPAYQAILAHFGNSLLLKDGTLNRTKLREIIFKDEAAKRWLETLLHPLIKSTIQTALHALRQQQPAIAYCIVVLPLLFEANARDNLDRILLVDSPTYAQIDRAASRDQATADQIMDIVRTQFDRDKRLQLADDLIINDSTLDDLHKKVHELHRFYQAGAPQSSKS